MQTNIPWRQLIIRMAGLDPDGRLVPMPPRRAEPPPGDTTRAEQDAALIRAVRVLW